MSRRYVDLRTPIVRLGYAPLPVRQPGETDALGNPTATKAPVPRGWIKAVDADSESVALTIVRGWQDATHLRDGSPRYGAAWALDALPGSGMPDLDVIDVDDLADLAWAIETFGSTPLAVLTGRGVHLWYRRDPRRIRGDYGSFVGLGGRKVDHKSWHGYTIAPGSSHKSGKTYRLQWHGEDLDLEALTPDLILGLPILDRDTVQAARGMAPGPLPPRSRSVASGGKVAAPCCGPADSPAGSVLDGGTYCHRHKLFHRSDGSTGSETPQPVEVDLDDLLNDLDPNPNCAEQYDVRGVASREYGRLQAELLAIADEADSLLDDVGSNFQGNKAGEAENERKIPFYTSRLITYIIERDLFAKTSGKRFRWPNKPLRAHVPEVEDQIDRLLRSAWATHGPSAWQACPNGQTLVRADTKELRVAEGGACGAWKCPVCGPRLVRAAAAAGMAVCGSEAGGPLADLEGLILTEVRIKDADKIMENLRRKWKDTGDVVAIATSPRSVDLLICYPPGVDPELPRSVTQFAIRHGSEFAVAGDLGRYLARSVASIDLVGWQGVGGRANILRGRQGGVKSLLSTLTRDLLACRKPGRKGVKTGWTATRQSESEIVAAVESEIKEEHGSWSGLIKSGPGRYVPNMIAYGQVDLDAMTSKLREGGRLGIRRTRRIKEIPREHGGYVTFSLRGGR